MSATKEAWCHICDEQQSFYKQEGRWFCSLCEHVEQAQAIEPQEAVAGDTAEPQPLEPSALPLMDDLDHIRIQLSGPWSNEDLKNLALDLEESAAGAKEGGLGLQFFAIKKSPAAVSRAKGALIIPFRDRHGKIMATPPLSLSLTKEIKEGRKR